MTFYKRILCVAVLFAELFVHAESVLDPEYDKVGDPALPRVLIIGDSISMGYTPAVRAIFTDRINVHRPAVNCGASYIGRRDVEHWVAGGTWDVIHFNFGLHDLRYCFSGDRSKLFDEAGRYPDAQTGGSRTSLVEYEANLRGIIKVLRTTGARLIWANITPVGEYYHGYDPVRVPQYNAVAERVMRENDIPVNDLNGSVAQDMAAFQGADHIHCTVKGSQMLAEQVAAAIEQQLGL
jgi:acyl-CoA thioesterase-1